MAASLILGAGRPSDSCKFFARFLHRNRLQDAGKGGRVAWRGIPEREDRQLLRLGMYCSTQDFQKPLVNKESINHVGVHTAIYGIFLNPGVLGTWVSTKRATPRMHCEWIQRLNKSGVVLWGV